MNEEKKKKTREKKVGVPTTGYSQLVNQPARSTGLKMSATTSFVFPVYLIKVYVSFPILRIAFTLRRFSY